MIFFMNSTEKTLNDTIDTASQLHRSALKLLRMVRALPAEKGFSIAKLGVLTHLYQNGITTATGLAAYLRIRPQSVTRMLADLEKEKYIVRRPNEKDRRQTLIEISPSGTKLLLKEGRGQQEKLAQIIATTMTPAEQEMLRLSASLMDQLTLGAETEITRKTEEKKKKQATKPL